MRKCEYVLINSKNSWNCSTICKKKDDILVDNQNRKRRDTLVNNLGLVESNMLLGPALRLIWAKQHAWAALGLGVLGQPG